MHNRYYFYEFIEQSFTTLEIYPTIKWSTSLVRSLEMAQRKQGGWA
jgi:hypothetical protein